MALVLFAFKWEGDESGISQDTGLPKNENINLEEDLPVSKPYWLTKGEATNNASQKLGGEQPGVRATWIGHATVLAEIDGHVVICDPIFSDRASFVSFAGPKRYRPPACSVDELPQKLDSVVISHTHYDHLDTQSVKDLHKRYGQNLNWYVPQGSEDYFTSSGISESNVHPMTWWKEERSKEGATVAFTPSNHWSRRGLFDQNKALWGSWTIIGRNGSKFWFGGDTAYSDVFEQIGRKFGPIDLAAIPIGAYEPRITMKYVHVNPDESVMIHNDIRSRKSLGIHWGTFKLTNEHYLEPRNKLREMVLKEGKDDSGADKLQFYTVNIGGTLESVEKTKQD